ncbi:MAG: S8 family serine peptidase [Chitinophagales bacterium]|nr:S8 family serine peptidase [Chitinophagales bacterium]
MSHHVINHNGHKLELQQSAEHQILQQPTVKERGLGVTTVQTVVGQIGQYPIVQKTAKERDITDRSGAFQMPVYRDANTQQLMMPTGEMSIVFKPNVLKAQKETILQQYKLTLVKEYEHCWLVKVSNTNPIELVSTLEALPEIVDVDVDLATEAQLYGFIPNDDLYYHQWHLENLGSLIDVQSSSFEMRKGADAKIAEAWRILGNGGSTGIRIAVNDVGFDLQHPDLSVAGKVAAFYNLWTEEPLDNDYQDVRFSHGTPCAGVAAAASTDAGTVGVAPNAKLLCLHGIENSRNHFRKLVDYCIANKVDVLSLSWGETIADFRYPLDNIIKAEIDRLLTKGRNGKGTIVLVAAGNEGLYRVNYLGTHPNVITVGASTSRDYHAGYSNIGAEVTVCAPGGDWPLIAPKANWESSHWYSLQMPSDGRFDQYTHFTGTSGATPLVAGICALMLSANPNLTAAELRRAIILTADKIGHPSEYTNGHSVRYGYGRVNAAKAVKMAQSGVIPPLPTSTTAPPPVTTTPPVTTPPPPATTTIVRKKAVVRLNGNISLNVRSVPSAKSADTIVRTLKEGEVVWVESINEGWAKLADEFVSAKYLQMES